MRLSVFGLGYVGCVSAACWSADGHTVVGVDPNPTKVAAIEAGRSPIREPGLDELLGRAVGSGALRATSDPFAAVSNTDVSCICVGTPNSAAGQVDLTYVRRAAGEIGLALAQKGAFHAVVLRSTVLPGTTRDVVVPEIERTSGLREGRDFAVAFNPEFLREGTAIADFYAPGRTVVGSSERQVGDLVAALYGSVQAPVVHVSIRSAEMIKFVDNAFHALKVAFANEIGNICCQAGCDAHEVMEVFVQDTKLNLSATYLRPGPPFGGSCLPKDLRALVGYARRGDTATPLLSGVLASNEEQKRLCVEVIQRVGRKRIGLAGLSFKHGTDDLRESPAVELAETLLGKGYTLKIFDPNVAYAALLGSNLAYIERELPHLSALLAPDMAALVADVDVVVVTNRSPEYAGLPAMLRADQLLIDFVRLPGAKETLGERYLGLAW